MKLSYFLEGNLRYWRVAALICSLPILLLALSACSSDNEAPPDRTAMLPESERVSAVPWNKPQGWENQSALGSLANDPRIGGQNTSY
jgi:hypothetical protein